MYKLYRMGTAKTRGLTAKKCQNRKTPLVESIPKLIQDEYHDYVKRGEVGQLSPPATGKPPYPRQTSLSTKTPNRWYYADMTDKLFIRRPFDLYERMK